MAGMDRNTGAMLDGADHIRQSVADILSTQIGSHVGLRDYGSLVPNLIDSPFAASGVLRFYAATALALSKWETRLRLRRLRLEVGNSPGSAVLVIEADRIDVPSRDPQFCLTLPVPLSL